MMKHFALTTVSLILYVSPLFAKTEFTSRYTDTLADCACLEKNLEDGQDCTQFSCKKVAGYEVQKTYDGSACDLGKLKIIKDSKELLSINEVPAKIEWRFASNQPFAVIYRLKGPSKDCADQTGHSKQKEILVVKGLGLNSSISAEVDAKTSNANSKVRDIADQAYESKNQ